MNTSSPGDMVHDCLRDLLVEYSWVPLGGESYVNVIFGDESEKYLLKDLPPGQWQRTWVGGIELPLDIKYDPATTEVLGRFYFPPAGSASCG
jgi:hypothetical protein